MLQIPLEVEDAVFPDITRKNDKQELVGHCPTSAAQCPLLLLPLLLLLDNDQFTLLASVE